MIMNELTDTKKIKPNVIPFKCVNCNGYGSVQYGKKVCHSCNGKGFILVKQDFEEKEVDPNRI